MSKHNVLTLILFTAVCLVSSAAFADTPKYGMITGDGVNVRVDSTVGANVICNVDSGLRVEILSAAYDWYKIRLPDHAPAYIYAKYVDVDGKKGVTNGSNVNVRMRPDTGASILGQLDKDTEVTVLKQEGEWVKIEPPVNTTGWIHKSFVKESSGAPEVEQPRQKAAETVETAPAPQPAAEKIVVSGSLKRKFITSLASHKLITDSKQIYLLRSSSVDLSRYVNSRVTVTATSLESGLSLPLLDVTDISTNE